MLSNILKNAALLLGSSLLCFIFLEIFFRIAGYGNLIIYQPDSKIYWKPSPNQFCLTKINLKPVHINSKGTRGQEFEERKPSKVFRIISLGDSKTFGWGLSESETYSEILQDLSQNWIGESKIIEVINAGVNAWSYAQIYVYLRDIAIRYDPDIVIIADANLWTQFTEEASVNFKKKIVRRVWLKNLIRRSAIYHFIIEVKLLKYYEKYRKYFIPHDPVQNKLFGKEQKESPYTIIEKQLSKICNLLNKRCIKGIIIYIPQVGFPKIEPSILRTKRKISGEYGITFIDLTKEFLKSQHHLFLPGDNVHPNVRGNQIIADRLFPEVIAAMYP